MLKPKSAPAVDYGPEEAAMQAYLRQGERRAYALGNRGPIRFCNCWDCAHRRRCCVRKFQPFQRFFRSCC